MGKRTNTAKWREDKQTWQINVQKDGERRSFYSGTPGRNGQRECNQKADDWLDDNISGENTKITILYSQYVDSLKLTTSKSNWIKIESCGKNWILPKIGSRRISVITEQNLQDIINVAFSKGLSKKSLNSMRSTIVAFIKFCRSCKATKLFPENLTIPKGAPVCEKTILQPSDILSLFTTDQTIYRGKPIMDKYIYAYRFQVLTGLRPGELIGLRWSDIAGNTVHITRSINLYNEETKGKNENAIRHFCLTAYAANILTAQREISTSESVFEITNLSSYEKGWRRFREANGLPCVTPYEMRHTFISIASELPEGQIKPLVGHSKNMDTFGVYGHEISGEREKTAQKIQDIFSEILTSVV